MTDVNQSQWTQSRTKKTDMEKVEKQNGGEMTRRDMLKTVARLGVLAGVVTSLTVLSRRGNCEITSPCDSCRKFQNCDLDKAQATRDARREAAHG